MNWNYPQWVYLYRSPWCILVAKKKFKPITFPDLGNSEVEFGFLLDSLPDGLFLVTQEGAIAYANTAATHLFGYSISELLGKSIDMLVPDETRKSHLSLRRSTGARGHDRGLGANLALKGRKKDRSIFPADVALKNIPGKSGTYTICSVRDVTERVKLSRRLRESDLILSDLADNSRASVYMLDLDGRYTRVNKWLCERSNKKESEWIGKRIDEMYPPDVAKALVANTDGVLETGESYHGIEQVTVGNEVHHSLTIKFALHDVDGKITGVCGISTDISKTIEQEAQLKDAKRLAEAANLAKSEFIANMSHEIRTPMNAILGFASMAEKRTDDSELKRFLKNIQHSGNNLLALINDILDISRLDTGRIVVSPESVVLSDFLNDLKSIFEYEARNKGISFIIDVSPGLPGMVEFDKKRVRQILLNLIGNAIKFTNSGEVCVSCHMSIDGPGNGLQTLSFEVADTGMGLTTEARKSIFNLFEKGQGTMFSGTGLGLPISKRLATLMGGQITVSSVPGKGSTFCFVLPGVAVSPIIDIQSPTTVPLDVDAVRFEPGTVLVVDDSAINRELVSEYLSDFDLSVLEAENGAIALDIIAANSVDIVLMDIKMPVLGGLEATKRIRENPESNSLAVLAMTASLSREDESGIKELVDGFLIKPVKQSVLIEALAAHMPYTLSQEALDEGGKSQKSSALQGRTSPERRDELISILQDKKQLVEHLFRNQMITRIRGFGAEMSALGIEFESESLADWGKRLEEHARAFQVDRMNALLSSFDKLLQEI